VSWNVYIQISEILTNDPLQMDMDTSAVFSDLLAPYFLWLLLLPLPIILYVLSESYKCIFGIFLLVCKAAATIFAWEAHPLPFCTLRSSSCSLPFLSLPSIYPKNPVWRSGGSALSSPSGDPRPQTYFDAFTALKMHVVAHLSFVCMPSDADDIVLFFGICCIADISFFVQRKKFQHFGVLSTVNSP